MSIISTLFKPLKFYYKTALAAFVLSVSASYGVIASTILALIGKTKYAQYSTARVFYTLFKFLLRIKVNIENEDILKELSQTNESAIIISNHQSVLDIHLIGKIMPPYGVITSKKSLKYIPILGWYMSLSGTYFLNRKNRQQSLQVLKNAENDIKISKKILYIFPEGTRSNSLIPALNNFKKGAFHLAIDSNLPIIPIVISNTSNLFNFNKLIFNSGIIKVKILEKIETKGLNSNDVTKLMETTHEKMLNCVNELGYSISSQDENLNNELDETERLLPTTNSNK